MPFRFENMWLKEGGSRIRCKFGRKVSVLMGLLTLCWQLS